MMFKIRDFEFCFAILIFVFCILNSFGCAGATKKEVTVKEEALLEPHPNLKFNDIPTPIGFKFLPEESYTFESAGVRVAVLKYQGKADIEQVVNFYKYQMPLYSWNLLNAIEYGQRLLNFEREQEICIVNLSPKGRSIAITISLGPRSGIKLKKAEKPVK
jgi:hypothetical protein